MNMDKEHYEEMQKELIEMLELGESRNKLVNIGLVRGIGKTTSLVAYAKKHGYKAILATPLNEIGYGDVKKYCIIQHEPKFYEKICSCSSSKFIIDETVDYEKLPRYIKSNVVTGFYNSETHVQINKSNEDFNSRVVSKLKYEENSLGNALDKCTNESNFAMYKNLINCYEKVVELIKLYDYKFMYSEYTIENGKQVAIWEQNRDGIIRNHKIWDVK